MDVNYDFLFFATRRLHVQPPETHIPLRPITSFFMLFVGKDFIDSGLCCCLLQIEDWDKWAHQHPPPHHPP